MQKKTASLHILLTQLPKVQWILFRAILWHAEKNSKLAHTANPVTQSSRQ